jgi:hypothetical protein
MNVSIYKKPVQPENGAFQKEFPAERTAYGNPIKGTQGRSPYGLVPGIRF